MSMKSFVQNHSEAAVAPNPQPQANTKVEAPAVAPIPHVSPAPNVVFYDPEDADNPEE